MFDHLPEQKNCLFSESLLRISPDHYIVGRRVRLLECAENRFGIFNGSVGDEKSDRFEEVFNHGRVLDEARFNEMGVYLIEISSGLALFKN